MPGFAIVAVEAGAAVIVLGIEEQAGAAGDEVDGQDEPGVLGNGVGDEEIDLGGKIGDGAASGAAMRVDVVEAVEDGGGRLDLDAVESGTGVEDEVVALAVAVGLGDGESEADGFVGEGDFGELSAALGGEFALAGGFRARRAGWWSLRRGHKRGKGYKLDLYPSIFRMAGWRGWRVKN